MSGRLLQTANGFLAFGVRPILDRGTDRVAAGVRFRTNPDDGGCLFGNRNRCMGDRFDESQNVERLTAIEKISEVGRNGALPICQTSHVFSVADFLRRLCCQRPFVVRISTLVRAVNRALDQVRLRRADVAISICGVRNVCETSSSIYSVRCLSRCLLFQSLASTVTDIIYKIVKTNHETC